MSQHLQQLRHQYGAKVVRHFTALAHQLNDPQLTRQQINHFERLLDQQPDVWRVASDVVHLTAEGLLGRLGTTPTIRDTIKKGWADQRESLGYGEASPLEQILIERVLLCWLRQTAIAYDYSRMLRQSPHAETEQRQQQRLTIARHHHRRACQSLAHLRRTLHRSAPTFTSLY